MPTIPRPGKATVYAEVPAALKAAFLEFALGRGSDLRAELELAMRRHLAYPPPVPALAPLPNGAGGKKSRRKKPGMP